MRRGEGKGRQLSRLSVLPSSPLPLLSAQRAPLIGHGLPRGGAGALNPVDSVVSGERSAAADVAVAYIVIALAASVPIAVRCIAIALAVAMTVAGIAIAVTVAVVVSAISVPVIIPVVAARITVTVIVAVATSRTGDGGAEDA